jgi:hypothetical protein
MVGRAATMRQAHFFHNIGYGDTSSAQKVG